MKETGALHMEFIQKIRALQIKKDFPKSSAGGNTADAIGDRRTVWQK